MPSEMQPDVLGVRELWHADALVADEAGMTVEYEVLASPFTAVGG